MKAVLNRESLIEALARCALVTDKRGSTPSAGKVRLFTVGGAISYYSTVLSLDVRGEVCPIELHGECDVLVDCQSLLRAANAIADDGVTLALNEEVLTVSGGRRRFNIATLPGADAPKIPPVAGRARKIKGSILAGLIRRVSHTMDAQEGPRNGVLVRHSGTETEAMASDGRGAAIETEETGKGAEFSAQIPSSMVAIITSTLDTDDNIGISVTPERIFITHEKTVVSVSRREQELLAGADVRTWTDQVATGVSVIADAEPLREAAAIVGAGAQHLKITTASDSLLLWAKANGSSAEDEVECRCDGAHTTHVDPVRFGAAIKGLTGEISLNVGDQVVAIRSGSYLATIAIMDPALAAMVAA